jgi:hypothetical protein
MLEKLWPKGALVRAKSRILSKITRLKKKDKDALTEEEVEYLETYEGKGAAQKINREKKEREEAKEEAFKPGWRPKYWLAFIALGKPGYVKVLSAFNSGQKPITSPNTMAGNMGKSERRNAGSTSSKGTSKKDTEKDGSMTKTIVHVIRKDTGVQDALVLVQQRIANLETRLQRAKAKNRQEMIDALEEELDEVLLQQSDLLKKQLAETCQPSSSSSSASASRKRGREEEGNNLTFD